MLKMKKVRLVNFGGYEDSIFDFTRGQNLDGYVPPSLRESLNEVVPISLFFGPNGIGKSTILEAIKFVANPMVFYGRQQAPDVYLRPWIRDTEYQPISDHVLAKAKAEMRVEALFTDGTKDYEVVITNAGFIKNELPERPEGSASGGYLYYVDADNPINWSKFQLNSTYAQRFIELAEAIYGYECDLDGDVEDHHIDEDTGEIVETQTYYQDLIITKGTTKVHFKSMSAGEKKIATMIRQLCNPDATDDRDIILIDNWEMHVYFKRHPKMIEKLREYFSGKQIIATTHSQSMIEYGAQVPYVKNFDLEEFKPEYRMLDLQPKVNIPSATESVGEVTQEPLAPPPEGQVRRTVMTPFGEMNVLVPAGSDKARVDPVTGEDKLQTMMNNAISIDIDGEGKVASYIDPVKKSYTPGSGQIKRAPSQLSPGQRRRQERGEAIITEPIVNTKSSGKFEDHNEARVEAVKESIAASTAALSELGRGSCGCGTGFCGTPAPEKVERPGEQPPATDDFVSTGSALFSNPSQVNTADIKVDQPTEDKPKGFWASVLGLFK